MFRRTTREDERTQVHPIDSGLKRAFDVEEVEIAIGLRLVLLNSRASSNHRQRKRFVWQFSVHRNAKNTPNFKQTDVANPMIQVVTKRIQKTRQQTRPHPRRVFNNRVLQFSLSLPVQRRDQFQLVLAGDETESDRLIESGRVERATQRALLHLARLILTWNA